MFLHQHENSFGKYNFSVNLLKRYCDALYHFHSNYELIYILKGSLQLKVDERIEIIHEGEFAFIMPNQLHSLTTIEEVDTWIGVFSEDYIYLFSSTIREYVGERNVFRCDDYVKNFFLKVLIEDKQNDVYILKSCFYALAQQYLKNVKLVKKNVNDELFYSIVNYISDNFTDDITMKSMAESINLEYHYLSRKFNTLFEQNFNSFVNQYRVNFVNEKMLVGNDNITDIAYESGFKSIRGFNAAYKRIMGCTPSEYLAKQKTILSQRMGVNYNDL